MVHFFNAGRTLLREHAKLARIGFVVRLLLLHVHRHGGG